MKLFNYVWFRIARLYIKKDSEGVTASAFLAISQGSFIISVTIVIAFFLKEEHPEVKEIIRNILKVSIMGIIMVVFIINYFIYKKQYWRLREHYSSEKKDAVYYMKGFFVFAFIFIPLFILIFLINNLDLM